MIYLDPMNPTKTYLGVDPGQNGGAALLDQDGTLIELFAYAKGSSVYPQHVLYNADRPAAMLAWLRHVHAFYPNATAVVEHVHASPVMGPAAAAKMVGNYQLWLGFVWALFGERPVCVDPQVWQRPYAAARLQARTAVMTAAPNPSANLARSLARAGKQSLQAIAQAAHPEIRLTLDTCDAVLIAEYARNLSRV